MMACATCSALDPDGDGCPSGRGMVEREGMAQDTLDVAAYTAGAQQSGAYGCQP
ncbi:MAG: hypothetical protein U0694_16095 [Anaerolineae bacterium]